MAFDRKKLKPLIGQSGRGTPQLWAYTTEDNNTAIVAANYLDDLLDAQDADRCILQPGHLILTSVDTDGTPQYRVYRVTTVTTSEITIVSGLQAS